MPIRIAKPKCLCKATDGVSTALPTFLPPASSYISFAKPFSSTSRCRSRIGSAPLSLPAEVNLRILESPPQRKTNITRIEPPRTVEVEGPLGTLALMNRQIASDPLAGKMSVQLPPYMSLQHNKDTRKATLSILDREERKQREMWGKCNLNLSCMVSGHKS